MILRENARFVRAAYRIAISGPMHVTIESRLYQVIIRAFVEIAGVPQPDESK